MRIFNNMVGRLSSIKDISKSMDVIQNKLAAFGAWENFIALNSDKQLAGDEAVGTASDYFDESDTVMSWEMVKEKPNLKEAISNDTYKIPSTKHREAYYGNDHYNFWLSGLRDRQILKECAEKYKVTINDYLDFGCASGRVIRHFSAQDNGINVYGADINRLHVDWISKYLPKSVKVFHSHSVPVLPICDESLDVISAYSVFTHIETFDTTWIMEFARTLRKGGIAWITLHTEETWNDMQEDWPLYNALRNHPKYKRMMSDNIELTEREVFRWHNNRSYSANVFYKKSYIEQHWGRILEVKEFRRRFPGFQDVVILQKK